MDQLRVPFTDDTDLASLRGLARQALDGVPSRTAVDDALLVITELVENVMQHTGDGGELVVRCADDTLRIEVADTSPALPRQYEPDHRRIGGRGLLLVAAMTRAWGSRPNGSGKVVWAEVSFGQ